MEYYEMGDLQRYLTKPLPEPEARRITFQVLEGLEFMHENGFVHRDIKPGVRYPPLAINLSFISVHLRANDLLEYLGGNCRAGVVCQNSRFWHQQTPAAGRHDRTNEADRNSWVHST